MTNSSIPASLRLLHLRFEIEGNLFEESLEAENDLEYTFTWSRRDCYGQKVFGQSVLRIRVGYWYHSCLDTVWEFRELVVPGFELNDDSILGWRLDIHHRLDVEAEVLYLGDGRTLDLKRGSRTVEEIEMEDSGLSRVYGRDVEEATFLNHPVAVAHDGINTTFYGDGRYVYKQDDSGSFIRILELNVTSAQAPYYLACDKFSGGLYASFPLEKRVIRIPMSQRELE